MSEVTDKLAPRLQDELDKVDEDLAFETFYLESEKTPSFKIAIENTAEHFGVPITVMELLFSKNNWASLFAKKSYEDLLHQDIGIRKTYMEQKKGISAIGDQVLKELEAFIEKHNKTPFNIAEMSIKEFQQFINSMERLHKITLPTKEVNNTVINQQNIKKQQVTGKGDINDTINLPNDDAINAILDDEDFIEAEFNPKVAKQEEELNKEHVGKD